MMTVLSVSKLNFYLRALLEGDAPLQNLYVSGEISNFKRYPTSGHCYFTLRDEKAQLKCVLFAAQGAHLRFAPENGMRVICRGRVSVYERDGVYQLYVDDMQPQGAGALAVAFEQLKSRLAAAGLFDESHKQPIPKYPRRIGVATSAYGAAVADIKQITARRFPAAAGHRRASMRPSAIRRPRRAAGRLSSARKRRRCWVNDNTVGGMHLCFNDL